MNIERRTLTTTCRSFRRMWMWERRKWMPHWQQHSFAINVPVVKRRRNGCRRTRLMWMNMHKKQKQDLTTWWRRRMKWITLHRKTHAKETKSEESETEGNITSKGGATQACSSFKGATVYRHAIMRDNVKFACSCEPVCLNLHLPARDPECLNLCLPFTQPVCQVSRKLPHNLQTKVCVAKTVIKLAARQCNPNQGFRAMKLCVHQPPGWHGALLMPFWPWIIDETLPLPISQSI